MEIYSIVLASPDKVKFVMWLTAAQDLEGAIKGAFEEVHRKFPEDEPTKWNVVMFQKKTDGELRAEFDPEYMKEVMAWGEKFESMKHVRITTEDMKVGFDFVVSDESSEIKPSEKSILMRRILKYKDKESCEEELATYLTEFTESEILYLQEKIRKKKHRK